MRKKIRVILFLSAFLAQFAFAQKALIFVSDQMLRSKQILSHGTLYVKAVKLAEALHLKVSHSGKQLWVGTIPKKNGRKKIIQSNSAAELFLNGRLFHSTIVKNGIVFVPLKLFIEKTGNRLLYNKITQIINIVPAKSPVTNLTVKQMIQTTFFASTAPLPSPSQNANQKNHASVIIPQTAPAPSLAQGIEHLKEKYGSGLDKSANALQYFAELEGWGNQDQESETQFSFRVQQINQMMSSESKSEFESQLASLFQQYANQTTNIQQSFYKIVPPPQFENSNSVLQQGVEEFSQLKTYATEASHIMLGLQTADPQQTQYLLERIRMLLFHIRQFQVQEMEIAANYLRALKVDLENFH